MGSGWRGNSENVQVTITITMKNHVSCCEVLHRKTKSIKFDRTTIVASELTNRKKVANYGQDGKDIVQSEFGYNGMKNRLTARHDRNTCTITYNLGNYKSSKVRYNYTYLMIFYKRIIQINTIVVLIMRSSK